MEKKQKLQNAYLNQVWKKRKNLKMSMSLGMEKNEKSQNAYLN